MKKSIIFLAAIAAFFSCAKDNSVNNTTTEKTFSVTLTASAPSSEDVPSPASADTKTTLVDGNNKKFVHWSKGDAIMVLFFPNVIDVNASFSGPSYEFNSNFNGTTSASAEFTCASWKWGSKVEELGIAKSLTEKGIAVYPATATAKSTKPSGPRVSCDTEVSFVLPSTQTAVKDNIESNLNFSYATVELSKFQSTISNGAQTDLKFNNACAMIELTMPSTLDKKVTSISIASNNDVPLTGKGTATMSYYKNEIDSNPFDSASDHIFKPEISEGAGVTLNNANGFEAGAKYYVVVWPGKHDSGLTIEFKADDGTVAAKTTKPVELTASQIKPYNITSSLEFKEKPKPKYNYYYADGTQGDKFRNDIVGVIFFHGNPKEQFNDPDLPDEYCNGLAIGLSSRKCVWNTSPLSTIPSDVKVTTTYNLGNYSIGGYTTAQKYGSNSYTVFANGNSPSGASGWYLPAANEWIYIYSVLGNINALLDEANGEKVNLTTTQSEGFWLPYFYSKNAAGIKLDANNKLTLFSEQWYNSYERFARPIFAF